MTNVHNRINSLPSKLLYHPLYISVQRYRCDYPAIPLRPAVTQFLHRWHTLGHIDIEKHLQLVERAAIASISVSYR